MGADPAQEKLVGVVAGGIVQVEDGFFVVQGKVQSNVQALLQRGNGSVLGDDPVGFLLDDRFHQIGEVFKMIVKGVAIDAAVFHDVFDGDLV